MARVFFIADLHLGHEKIAIKRGFKNSQEHDELVIKRWNKKVTKRDLVYVLGDVTMEKAEPLKLLNLMNGRKVLIGGNHDMKKDFKEFLNYFEAVIGCMTYKGYIFTHIPVHPQELKFRYSKNIHGHLHEKVVKRFGVFKDNRYICISLEHTNYEPITLEEIQNGNSR